MQPQFLPDIPSGSFREAVWQLYEDGAAGTPEQQAKFILDSLAGAEQVFRSGWRRGTEWIAISAGRIESGSRKTEFHLFSAGARNFAHSHESLR